MRYRAAGAAAHVSHHAGTFLCNQAFFVACHAAVTTGAPRIASFVHVPLAAPDALPALATALTDADDRLKTRILKVLDRMGYKPKAKDEPAAVLPRLS